MLHKILGQVVRKPVNANPGLKVNRSMYFSCIEMFSTSYVVKFEIIQTQNCRTSNISSTKSYNEKLQRKVTTKSYNEKLQRKVTTKSYNEKLQRKVTTKSYKTELKILANPGLA